MAIQNLAQVKPAVMNANMVKPAMQNPYAGADYARGTPQYSQMQPVEVPQASGQNIGNILQSSYGSKNRPASTRVAPGGNRGMDEYNQFRDSYYQQAMDQFNPQIDAQNRRFEQQMLAKGIDPGTQAFNDARANIDRQQNGLLGQANLGSMAAALQAQGQFAGQDIQREGLANQLNIANIGADASRFGATTAANASKYAADLRNSLGIQQLNEQGRQYDNSLAEQGRQYDGTLGLQYGQLDSQNMLGIGNLLLGNRSQDLQDWQAQQGANNQWFNQAGSLSANAPGVQFTPTGNFVGNMQNAGQNMANAQAAQNAQFGQMLGGAMSMFSDERLKENIEYVGNKDGVNIYDFEYKDKSMGNKRYRGVMAQEIINLYPKAVSMFKGFFKVDYSQLPVDMEVIACH